MKRAMLLILLVFLIPRGSLAEDTSVPFKLHHGYLIVVECAIGDLPKLTCIIDTGVTESVVDMRLVQRLSLVTRVDSAMFLTKESPVFAVSLPSLELGPIRTHSLAGIATDLSSLTAQLGIRPDVLIGMDVLRRANFVIDYKSRHLLFGPVPALHHIVRLAPDQRLALIESTIMGQRLFLQVDTGFQGVLLYGIRGARTGSTLPESRVESAAHTLMAVSRDSSEIRIGDWRASHMEISVLDRPHGEALGFDGLIGAQALQADRIAFDFETNTLSWD